MKRPEEIATNNLIWIDVEATGLDFSTNMLIQVAAIVTNNELEMLGKGVEVVIHLTHEELETLSDWCKETFSLNGLITRSRESKLKLIDAEEIILDYLKKHCEFQSSPLCGNSVFLDRLMLMNHMPKVYEFLHYRSIDVSSLSEIKHRYYPNVPKMPKSEDHDAFTDIKDSIKQLQYFRKTILK